MKTCGRKYVVLLRREFTKIAILGLERVAINGLYYFPTMNSFGLKNVAVVQRKHYVPAPRESPQKCAMVVR